MGHDCPYKNATDEKTEDAAEKARRKSRNTAVQRKYNNLKTRKNGVESAFINWYEKLDESSKLKNSEDELREMFETAKCDEERAFARLNDNCNYQRPSTSTSQSRRNTMQRNIDDSSDGELMKIYSELIVQTIKYLQFR